MSEERGDEHSGYSASSVTGATRVAWSAARDRFPLSGQQRFIDGSGIRMQNALSRWRSRGYQNLMAVDQDDSGEGTLADQAYRRLRHDIVAGDRSPGERLRIERLRTLYGFGPTPLREALQRLSADGWVVAEGNRGFTVAPLSAALFADLNTARIAVEKEALRLSIARGDGEWEALVVGSAYRLAKADAALRAQAIDVDEWEFANRAFHTALVSACGSAWLLKVRDLLSAQCERYRRISVSRNREGRDLHAEHEAIAAAATQRDAELAAARTEAHFAMTAQLLGEELNAAEASRAQRETRKAS